MGLCLTMKPGEQLFIGSDVQIWFKEKTHVNISAPKETPILRGELLRKLKAADAAGEGDGPR